MFRIPAHYFGRILFPGAVWSFSRKEKAIYLTFDDGPEPEVTPWVLDTLKAFHAKATFFCLGKNVVAHPEIYKRILNEGHAVGNHTFNHLKGWKTPDPIYFEDVKKCTEVFNSGLFRPPYGKMKFTQYKKLKSQYRIVMWDVLSRDYSASLSPRRCLENVIQRTRSGSIIVFHDSVKAKRNLQFALPGMLEYFSKNEFVFKSLNESLLKIS